jgi:hypothetical protein
MDALFSLQAAGVWVKTGAKADRKTRGHRFSQVGCSLGNVTLGATRTVSEVTLDRIAYAARPVNHHVYQSSAQVDGWCWCAGMLLRRPSQRVRSRPYRLAHLRTALSLTPNS